MIANRVRLGDHFAVLWSGVVVACAGVLIAALNRHAFGPSRRRRRREQQTRPRRPL
jgi:hypothetical protein